MVESYCENAKCSVKVLRPRTAAAVAYCSSAIALLVPFVNSAGAEVKSTFTITGLDFSFFFVCNSMCLDS